MNNTDGFKKQIILITVISVAGGVLSALLPNSRLKKTYTVLVGFILLHTALSPFLGGIDFKSDGLFVPDGEAESSLESAHESAVLAAYQSGIENALGQAAQQAGIAADKITAECEADGGSFRVFRVTFFGTFSENERGVLSETAASLVGTETKIIFSAG